MPTRVSTLIQFAHFPQTVFTGPQQRDQLGLFLVVFPFQFHNLGLEVLELFGEETDVDSSGEEFLLGLVVLFLGLDGLLEVDFVHFEEGGFEGVE